MNAQQFADLYDRLLASSPTGTKPSHAACADEGYRLMRLWTEGQACMRWASGVAIGVRGGVPASDVQQVLSAAARGEDWKALRDTLASRRANERPTRPYRGSGGWR
jgi:hypothetical protein